MRKYKGIDIGRVIFACLIPLLHIPFPDSPGIYIVRQYISRLGVPFFFAVSGMFLIKSIDKYGRGDALKRDVIRVGRVLLIWLLIYSPLLIYGAESYIHLIQQILFKTPAFLWFLTSLLVASIPFCLVPDRKMLLMGALALYAFGTIFGESYSLLTGGLPAYESIFITTRNGIFFGLLMMCIGEASWNREKISFRGILIAGGVINSRNNVCMPLLRTGKYVPFTAGIYLFSHDCYP